MRTRDCQPRLARGVSLLELIVVITIIGLLGGVVVPRLINSADASKVTSCDVNTQNIRVQSQLWFRNKGSWPATDLSNIGTDTSYFPEGVPTCPVDGSTYTFDSTSQSVPGHSH